MKVRIFALVVLNFLLWSLPGVVAGRPIESGQYFSDNVSTNNYIDPFYFFALPGDTVLLRLANEDAVVAHVPDVRVFDPSNVEIASSLNKFTKQDISISATEYGWHTIHAALPLPLYTYSNTVSYSISILRMPDAPISYADPDVGWLLSGEAKSGEINVGADLDAGRFAVSSPCRVQIRMGQGAAVMVPQLQLFDPQGQLISSDYPPEYRAEITSDLLTVTGIYTIVCNDFFNARGPYVLSMVKIPGLLEGADQDIGLIINGETRSGIIDEPGDLDMAYFQALADDVVTIVMQAEDPEMNPVMELYDTDSSLIQRVTDPMQSRVAISNLTITAAGQYTLICKDAEDRFNTAYTLSLDFISGPSTESLPAVPTGLTATDGTYADHIQVSWTAAAGALGYDLWRSYGTNNPVQITTNYNTTLYRDYNVVTNVHYYYKVKSRNTYGVSTNFSNTDSGWCGIDPIPSSDVRWALLVGVDNYSSAYPGGQPTSLQACVNDANGIQDIMLMGDPSNKWNQANVQLLADRQATKNTIRGALQQLASRAGAGELVLYTHSSHGGQTHPQVDPYDTFICAYDNNYYDYELGEDLARFRVDTRVVIIIDTCHSAGMFKGARDVPPVWPFVERVMRNYRRVKSAQLRARGLTAPRDLGANIAFMTASDYNELSWEIGPHAVYTGYLLEACARTDLDVNQDGNYSFKELHDYAAAKTIQTVSTQHPQFYNGDLLSAVLARGVGVSSPGGAGVVYNDYDGDSVSELALYHEATGQWFIGSLARWQWLVHGLVLGGPGYRPIVGDYDGDGVADLALYNEAAGLWTIGSLAQMRMICQDLHYGWPGARPIAGDYTGDRRF
ncbi:MAG: hypothetical protein ABR497_10125, partial [Kiritimatiellia bacterium]